MLWRFSTNFGQFGFLYFDWFFGPVSDTFWTNKRKLCLRESFLVQKHQSIGCQEQWHQLLQLVMICHDPRKYRCTASRRVNIVNCRSLRAYLVKSVYLLLPSCAMVHLRRARLVTVGVLSGLFGTAARLYSRIA